MGNAVWLVGGVAQPKYRASRAKRRYRSEKRYKLLAEVLGSVGIKL